MAIDYSALEVKAQNLLQNNGQQVTFTYKSGGSINEATGVITTPETSNNVQGYGVATRYKNAEINGETIQAGDLKLIVEDLATEPEPDWTVIVNSKTFRVLEVSPVNPAGTNIIYICQLRR